MPSLTIKAPQEQFDQAIEALCFLGKRDNESVVTKEDFAISEFKRWLGERMYDYAREIVEQTAKAQQLQIREAITESGSVVEVTVEV